MCVIVFCISLLKFYSGVYENTGRILWLGGWIMGATGAWCSNAITYDIEGGRLNMLGGIETCCGSCVYKWNVAVLNT